MDITSPKFKIDVLMPEESALLAYKAVKQELITPFINILGEGRVREHDWSVQNRIRTNGAIIKDTVEMLGQDPNSIVLKGPGITPTAKQTEAFLKELDLPLDTKLEKLATGTPNGFLRGHKDVKANIIRYSNPDIDEIIATEPPKYNASIDISTLHLKGGRVKGDNCAFTDFIKKDGEVKVDFKANKTGEKTTLRAAEKLSIGSPIHFRITTEKDVQELVDKAINIAKSDGANIEFMSKYTVLKGTDNKIKQIYNDRREAAGLERKEGNVGDIVDAAFARVLSRPPSEKTIILAPDASYGPKIAAVIKAAQKNGLHFPKNGGKSAVGRFSAGKSEYGSLNDVAKSDGIITIYYGDEKREFEVKEGDMFMEMHFDKQDAKTYTEQMFDQAKKQDVNNIIFGFDFSDKYDTQAIEAIREKASELGKKENTDYIIVAPDEAAIKLLTSPLEGNTLYIMDNLWGDIVSDGMFLNKGIASGNSVLLTKDGRNWPEMGGAGTAPDLIPMAEKEGFQRYNPIPIIEGFSLAIQEVARLEEKFTSNNLLLKKYGNIIHEAFINTLKKGIVTPDLAGKVVLSGEIQETIIGMDSFIKANRVEIHKLLGQNKEANEQLIELDRLIERESTLVKESYNNER